MKSCPVCASRERVYRRCEDGWLEVCCGWCGEILHGIQATLVDGGEVSREVA